MKGIVLAGGTGSRLWPITEGCSKQLLPVYDKPMIYYSLSCLMLAGIKEILLITNPEYIESYRRLLGDGSHLGMSIQYKEQLEPKGIAEAFILGEEFIGNDSVALILGDNLFYGGGLSKRVRAAKSFVEYDGGAVIFGYKVSDPTAYGVVEFDKNMKVLSIEEKPANPKSDYAVTGLYFYDNTVIDIAKDLKPSARGELEITDINKAYMTNHKLAVEELGRGYAWLDTGTCEGLIQAGNLVATIQERQGMYIACLEEIAYNNDWISKKQVKKLAERYKNSYGKYLEAISNV